MSELRTFLDGVPVGTFEMNARADPDPRAIRIASQTNRAAKARPMNAPTSATASPPSVFSTATTRNPRRTSTTAHQIADAMVTTVGRVLRAVFVLMSLLRFPGRHDPRAAPSAEVRTGAAPERGSGC